MARLIAIALLLVGCIGLPEPSPPVVPDGSCEDAWDRLAELGGCGVDLVTFVDDCKAAAKVEAEVGVAYPAGCIASAGDCHDAWRCR